MKGVILAGGKGTRLLPATKVANKHLIPIINKPMILYPLETLKSIGMQEILVVSGGSHIGGIAEFLGDGREYGVNLTYKVQTEAGGIAQALLLAEQFADHSDVVVILGDNIFGETYFPMGGGNMNAYLFFKMVEHPERFGVASLMADADEGVVLTGIEEKPQNGLKHDFAVTGLYHFPSDVFEVIRTLKPSARGELEITDVNNYFIRNGRCKFHILDGFWSDAGTPESLVEVINWVNSKK